MAPDVVVQTMGEVADGACEYARRRQALTKEQSLRRLGEVPLGRVIFTQNAMHAVRPVNHIVDDGAVIIRTHLGAALLSAVGLVVAYQADAIDPEEHLGWSVIVTGYARAVTEPDAVARYERLLHPWVAGEMDQVIRIDPEIVTGIELVKELVKD
jgi:hypothetical protein